jgi:hypothetical protein
MACEVNLPTFQKMLWVPSSLVMSRNKNNQPSRLLSYIDVKQGWAEPMKYSHNQQKSKLIRYVFEEKQIPVDSYRCVWAKVLVLDVSVDRMEAGRSKFSKGSTRGTYQYSARKELTSMFFLGPKPVLGTSFSSVQH